LVWIDRTGLEVEVLPITGEFPRVSPGEDRIVVERRNLQTMDLDLWLYDNESGAETRFTHSRTDDALGAFSHDGASVIYSDGDGILQKSVEGGTETRLLDVGTNPERSADGRYLVYQLSAPPTGFDLWVAPLAHDQTPFPVAQTEHGEREGTFSPDVRWLAYDSTETGQREVWVQPFPPTGARWQISTTGGVSPRWRADGRELFYVAADGRLMAVAVTPGPTFRWSAPQALFETIFRGGTYAPFAVSRDGQRFLMNTPSRIDAAPITVIVNWPERVGR
jgi:Tol biopolymer transport system component